MQNSYFSFCSDPNYNKRIISKFWTCHDSWALMACAKFCGDMFARNGITTKKYFHWVWVLKVSDMSPWILIHWGRVTHICINKLTIIGSDNGLSPGWCQAIIWTNAGILLIGPLRTNFSETLIKIYTFSLKKMHVKMSSERASILSPPQCVIGHALRIYETAVLGTQHLWFYLYI